MKQIEILKKVLVALFLVFFLIGFSSIGVNQVLDQTQVKNEFTCFPYKSNSYVDDIGSGLRFVTTTSETQSEPLVLLFQIVFILFLISPPIIALLLFCIWKELKKHNELK